MGGRPWIEAAASYVEKTPDFGRHWTRHGPIVAEEGGPLGGVDPSIYFTDDGTLVALMRPSDPSVVRRSLVFFFGNPVLVLSLSFVLLSCPAHVSHVPPPHRLLTFVNLCLASPIA